MSFWDVFLEESLQKPWMIGPEPGQVDASLPEPATEIVFVHAEGTSSTGTEMMKKMVVALKWSPDSVTLQGLGESGLGAIDSWAPKKILFFGTQYPGTFGQWMNWSGHQIMQTHSIVDLENKADLKKETWAHLKSFGGLA